MKKNYGIIYKIENKVNRKVYIGQTTRTFKERYGGSILNTGNSHLRRGMKKDGIKNFNIVEKFDVAYSREELNNKEKKYIKELKCYIPEFGYNKTLGGEGGIPTEETKAKMKKSQEKYKTSIVQLDLEFNFVKRFNGAIDTEIDGFDKAIVTTATKTKAKVKSFYFLTEEEYLKALSNKNGLLKLKSEYAGRYHGYIAIDKNRNLIMDSLQLAREYKIREVKKMLNKYLLDRDYIFVKLDNYLNNNIKFDYDRTVCCIKDGVIVREFKNVNHCLENGFEKSRVSSCIAGKRKSYKNFEWIYKNDIAKFHFETLLYRGRE